jgi:yecA family protein
MEERGMSSPLLGASDFDLKELDAFLMSDRAPEECVQLSMEEAQRILNAIMGRYNEILHLLQHAPEEFEPIFWTTEHGEAVAADWAEGLMEAVELRPGAWQALLDSEEDRQLLAPIVAHLHDEEGDPIIRGWRRRDRAAQR